MNSSYYAVEITDHVITWVSDSYTFASDAEQAVSDLNHQSAEGTRAEMFTDYRPVVGMREDDIPEADGSAWIHKISYYVNDVMGCTDLYAVGMAMIARLRADGNKVEILREWWANPQAREVTDVPLVAA
jgi:hypothetical protein